MTRLRLRCDERKQSMSSIKINWRRLIVNRILITAVALIVQAAWIVVSIFALAEYSQPMSILLRIISLVAVLFIIGKEDNSSYKIVWIILIMLLPFFGGILYIFAGNKKPSKHMNMQINNTKENISPCWRTPLPQMSWNAGTSVSAAYAAMFAAKADIPFIRARKSHITLSASVCLRT